MTAPFATKKDAFISVSEFGADGSRDGSFGDEGAVFLHGQDSEPMVMVDGAGRAVVFETGKGGLVLRRFEPEGDLDSTFGDGGVVKIPCKCAEAGTWVLGMSAGRLMIVISRGCPPEPGLARFLE